ncbi:MAG: hypothetical protein Q8P98_10880, partial [Candidatus Rokubacteria bacterium]|nr:hypothetical protein [Candidatus Rokubacteria bacterium]
AAERAAHRTPPGRLDPCPSAGGMRVERGAGQVHAQRMAIKTITADMKAYEILSRHKAAGRSFSTWSRSGWARG